MNFIVDIDNITSSFDSIAKKLLLGHVICINDKDIELTEIEFYYFHEKKHPDNYTHPHNRQAGQWRLHKQGIDLTFDGTTKGQDGGILIRGIKMDNKFINGPIRCLAALFEAMQDAQEKNYFILNHKRLIDSEIIKTFRHLPNKVQYKDFHLKKYRYLKDFENLIIHTKDKNRIKSDYQTL